MAIWQDLVSDHGFPGGYETVKRFVRKLRGAELPQAVGIILTAAGEEAQVDYGSGPMVRDPQSGKYRRLPLPPATENGIIGKWPSVVATASGTVG